jgi:hypothetical protein
MPKFTVPPSKASFQQNQFVIEIPSAYAEDGSPAEGAEILSFTVPLMQYLNSDVRQRMAQASAGLKEIIDAGGQPDADRALEIQSIQRELFERYAPDLYRHVSDDQLLAIQQAWQEASSISVGESSPSAD